jgi:hypothetical protein
MLVDSGIFAGLEPSEYALLVPFLCEAGEHFGLEDGSINQATPRSILGPQFVRWQLSCLRIVLALESRVSRNK